MSNVKTALTENAATVTPFAPTVDIPASDVQTAIEHVMANAAATDLFGVTMPVISATISSNQNDYAPTGIEAASVLRITVSGSDRTITGLIAGTSGQILTIENQSGNSLLLSGENASSAAANRFRWNGVDARIGAYGSLTLRYDGTSQRWVAHGTPSSWGTIRLADAGGFDFFPQAPNQDITIGSGGAFSAVWGSSSLISLELADECIEARHVNRVSGFSPITMFGGINAGVSASVAASALTVSLTNAGGSVPASTAPVIHALRSATASDGAVTVVDQTASLSVTLSSGSTCGTSNGVPFALWLVLFESSGTQSLGLINCLSGTDIYPLGAYPIASSTAEGGAGAADSAHVFYTGTAVTSKAYTIIARLSWESGLATAGTWSAGPTRIELVSSNTTLPGKTVQLVSSVDGAMATGTTTIPVDNTIPQNTEGTQFMSKAITPVSASNLLVVRHTGSYSPSTGNAATVALFQDSTANALTTASEFMAANEFAPITLQHRKLASTTSATTMKVRAGPNTAATLTFNGAASTAQFNGTLHSILEIEEIAV